MRHSLRIAAFLTTAACLGFAAGGPARAQTLNQLNGVLGSSKSASGLGASGGGLGGLGGALPSVSQASPGNLAGVLQYCVKNNYLSGNGASSIATKVAGLGGGTDSSDYKSGSGGMLETGNGQGYGLGGSGLKAQVTHKVCDMVLQHAKSLL